MSTRTVLRALPVLVAASLLCWQPSGSSAQGPATPTAQEKQHEMAGKAGGAIGAAAGQCESSKTRKELEQAQQQTAKGNYGAAQQKVNGVLETAKKRGVDDGAIEQLQAASRALGAAERARRGDATATDEPTLADLFDEAGDYETGSSQKRQLEDAEKKAASGDYDGALKTVDKLAKGAKSQQHKQKLADLKKRLEKEKEAARKKKEEEERLKKEKQGESPEQPPAPPADDQQGTARDELRLVAPSNVVEGEVVTVSVVGDEDVVEGTVLELDSVGTTTWVTGTSNVPVHRGRATFRVPRLLGRALSIRGRVPHRTAPLSTTVPVHPKKEPVHFAPTRPPVLEPSLPVQDLKRPLIIKGENFDPVADDSHVRVGSSEARVLAATVRELTVEAPAGLGPGTHPLLVRTPGGRAAGNVTLVRLVPHLDTPRLVRGEPGALRVTLEGTDEPVALRVKNLSPEVVGLDQGRSELVLRTSGGPRNEVRAPFTSRGPGSFKLAVSVAE